jgi:hypothetical protein
MEDRFMFWVVSGSRKYYNGSGRKKMRKKGD